MSITLTGAGSAASGYDYTAMPNFDISPLIFGAEDRWYFQNTSATTPVTGPDQAVKAWKDVKGALAGAVSAAVTPDESFSGLSDKTGDYWGLNLSGSKGLICDFTATLNQPFTIITIAQRLATVGGSYKYDARSAGARAALFGAGGNTWAVYGGTSTSATRAEYGVAGYYSSAAIYNGASSSFNYNGGTVTNDGTNSIAGLTVGGRYSLEAIYGFAGIYRALVVLLSTNSTQIADTRAWLVNRFGATA